MNCTVHIGCKYTGKPEIHINYHTGEYQHALPPVDDELQQALLNHSREVLKEKVISSSNHLFKDMTDTKAKIDSFTGAALLSNKWFKREH